MNNIYKIFILQLILTFLGSSTLFAQDSTLVSGKIVDATLDQPLESVLVSISGENTTTNANGEFKIKVSDLEATLVVQLPGYTTRELNLNGREKLTIALVQTIYYSIDDVIQTPHGDAYMRNITSSGSFLMYKDLSQRANTDLGQVIQGKVAGTQIITGSGMPGSKSYMNIRGISSLYGRNEPLVVIDGMLHPIHASNFSAIDGFTTNPLDIVDVDDIESVSLFSDGNSEFGSNGGNGVVYINLEQKRETSSSIIVNAYGGIGFSPKRQSLLNAGEFNSLLKDQIQQAGLSQDQIKAKYSFLNAAEGSEEYYRYNNNTDWQDEIYNAGVVQKYHIFLKGGDNIATYNISTGYLTHQGIVKNTNYSRFNLRVNGKINITDKFTVIPNTKLSLSDSYLMEQGSNVSTNPIIAAQLKSPIMSPNKIDIDGTPLEFIDDIGAFNVSNPAAIVNDVDAYNRNYLFITSVKAQYQFSNKLTLSTLAGIDYNNSRDNVFIPDVGLSRIDSAYNTSRALVNEFRSTQNNNVLAYKNTFGNSKLDVKLGHRFVQSSFEYDKGTDLNSATDDFKSLGQGAYNQELRTISGENRVVKWVSYYTTANYNISDKYIFATSLSYDGNSALNKNSRYNFYPSLSAAWRVSSEPFMADKTWLDDFKVRASFSQAGNMNNFAYDYSHLYYRSIRVNSYSLVAREAVPNPNMEVERNSTINLGADVSMLGQTLNMSFNLFNSSVNNLITKQQIAPAYGYTTYYSNAGSLSNTGAELAVNYRKKFGNVVWTVGGNVSFIDNRITSMDFELEGEDRIVNDLESISMVTMKGKPIYSFYGLKSNGIYTDDAEASKITGPNGSKGKAGDVKYVDVDKNGTINDLDRMVIGSPIAPMYGGLNTSVAFGNFEIKADFAFSAGNDIYNHVSMLGQSMQLGHNQLSKVNERWTSNNTGASITGISIGDPYGNNVFSDRWLENGSYARMKNLTVSYVYPAEKLPFESLTIYMTASNLFTLTGYSGLDPEFMLYSDPLHMGSDYGKTPQPKLFVLGVKLGL